MEPMKSKTNKMFSAASKGYVAPNLVDLDIRPCGMWVQKRNGETNPTSVSIPVIRVRVKYGLSYHEISISSHASFGMLKFLCLFVRLDSKSFRILSPKVLVHHEDQKLIYKNKERASKEFLDVARVRDGSKLVLEEDIVSREKRCVELLRNANSQKSMKALAEIKLEIDKLAGQVTSLEATTSKGGKVAEKDVENFTELLMMMLIKLDGIVAEGDLKLQRRVLVRKIQNYIEILDVLKSSNKAKIQLQKQDNTSSHVSKDSRRPTHKQQAPKKGNSVRTIPRMQTQLQMYTESISVTTKWETFE